MMQTVKLKSLLKYRSFIMGAAILWIMLFHAGFKMPNAKISFIAYIGECGVDLFLLCSGLGCCFSLAKNDDPLLFIKRRASRIMPSWLLFLLLWVPTAIIIDHISWRAVLGNIFCIQRFTGHSGDFNWYISFIWLLYILAPYFFKICTGSHFKSNLIFLTLLLIVSVPF